MDLGDETVRQYSGYVKREGKTPFSDHLRELSSVHVVSQDRLRGFHSIAQTSWNKSSGLSVPCCQTLGRELQT